MTPDTPTTLHRRAQALTDSCWRAFLGAETPQEQDTAADAYLTAHRHLVAARAALNKGASA